MNPIDVINELFKSYNKSRRYNDREMKRVFQWRRYLEWKGLSFQEKLAAKRLLFVPIAAYFVVTFINQYIFTLIFLICIYFAYKKFEKGNLTK